MSQHVVSGARACVKVDLNQQQQRPYGGRTIVGTANAKSGGSVSVTNIITWLSRLMVIEFVDGAN